MGHSQAPPTGDRDARRRVGALAEAYIGRTSSLVAVRRSILHGRGQFLGFRLPSEDRGRIIGSGFVRLLHRRAFPQLRKPLG
jgi:hypothetical protein